MTTQQFTLSSLVDNYLINEKYKRLGLPESPLLEKEKKKKADGELSKAAFYLFLRMLQD